MARILIAEDEPHILRVMSMWLGRSGHEVIETCDGAVALQRLQETTVDLIISDMNMPNMDGKALACAVREELALRTPFLMLSARCDQSALGEQMQTYGVRLYPKPFVPSRLVSDIEELLAATAAAAGNQE